MYNSGMLRFFTAGESHGPALTAIIEGMPANIPLLPEDINVDLKRRQGGYGRGRRMEIESDQVIIKAGVRHGKTLGSPITLEVINRDFENWRQQMAVMPVAGYRPKTVTRHRPGHADMAGFLKYHQSDVRNVLERASARETTMRVAVAAVTKALLRQFDIQVVGHLIEMGAIKAKLPQTFASWQKLRHVTDRSEVRCFDSAAAKKMMRFIDRCRAQRTTCGGIFEVRAFNVPIGLGSHVHYDRKLDGRLAQALMSIQAIKGVELGLGFAAARTTGERVHDPLYYSGTKGFYRSRNNAGGLEGGITNGEQLVVRAAMKPISTLLNPLDSVDLITKKKIKAQYERSDICAAPAAAVVGEAMVAIVLAQAFLEKFGGDSLQELRHQYRWVQRPAA